MDQIAAIPPQYLAAAALLCASTLAYLRGHTRVAVALLTVAAFIFQLFVAGLSPFLHAWDEQFHALVAKHLLEHPLTPTLYERTPLPFDHRLWAHNHVWLHKPPLALWQMAAAIGLLGTNEFAIRFPSVLLLALAVPLVFRIGQLAAGERAGYVAAVLFAAAPTSLSLASGGLPTDHVDVAFLFYVTASMWAWLEYSRARNARWALLVGVLAGLAVLTKYLPGLTVFGGWAVAILCDKELRTRRGVAHFVLAFTTASALFIPWDIYTAWAFTEEFRFERAYSHLHFTQVVEGHGGDTWFHFRLIPYQFGGWAAWVLVPALGALCAAQDVARRAATLTWLFSVYVFFGLAATKMPAFTFIVSPIIYVAIGALVEAASTRAARVMPALLAHGAAAALMIVLAVRALPLNDLLVVNSPANLAWVAKSNSAELFKRLNGSGATVVFNIPEHRHISAMFYSHVTAYERMPSAEEVEVLLRHGERVAVFDDGRLPPFLAANAGLAKLPAPWFWWIPHRRVLL